MKNGHRRLQSTCISIGSGLAAALLLVAGSAAAQSDTSTSTTPSGPFDPCQLVTVSEASSLAGTNFSAGTYSQNGSTCIYGSQTVNVFMVTAAQASDPDTAEAQWTQYEANAQDLAMSNVPAGLSGGFNVTDVNDLSGADRAATGQMSLSFQGRTISGSAFYLLKGVSFVAFSDLQLGTAAPSSDAMESEAATVLSRLP